MKKLIIATALLALTLSAEEPHTITDAAKAKVVAECANHPEQCGADSRPAPTVEQLQAKVAILEAKLASLQADHKLLTLTFSYEMQLCQAVDLSQAKVAAAEAKRKVEETMPKGR